MLLTKEGVNVDVKETEAGGAGRARRLSIQG